ncbi:unnamed protein product [Enterobius vermicularis]|uniref:Transposase n=1 Tax=Enterobius vermicularis TaxID=51028 RepID=A0A0N4UU18_ENTVE|nr:unnamed protein product [Enterobius vermicularis]
MCLSRKRRNAHVQNTKYGPAGCGESRRTYQGFERLRRIQRHHLQLDKPAARPQYRQGQAPGDARKR